MLSKNPCTASGLLCLVPPSLHLVAALPYRLVLRDARPASLCCTATAAAPAMCRRRLELKALAVCGRYPTDCAAVSSLQGGTVARCTSTAAGGTAACAAGAPSMGARPALRCAPQQSTNVQQPSEDGLLPIHTAARAGQRRTLAALLVHAPHLVDTPTSDGRTALLCAAAHGELGAAEELLQAGADANAADRQDGRTPLHAAAAVPGGAPQLVRALLNAGADVAAIDRGGRTAMHTAAEAACRHPGSIPALLCLARHCPGLLGAAAGNGATALHTICRHLSEKDGSPGNSSSGALQALQALAGSGLLRNSVATLEAVNGSGFTPLALAAAAGSLPGVQLLLCSGADPGAGRCPGCSSGACEEPPEGAPWGSRAALQRALEHHTCPLGIAARGSSYAIIMAVLNAGARAAGLSSHSLGRAIADSRADAALALLGGGLRCGNLRPLLAAVESGDGCMLAGLVDAGLDPNCPGDAGGAMRLLQAALQPGSEAMLARLLQHEPEGCASAATAPGNASVRDEQAERQVVRPRRRPLNVAALAERLHTNPACYAVRRSSEAALELLLAAGCPADGLPAGCGEMPLLVAAGRLDTARCRLLLAAGAAADARNGRGESALDIVLSLCTDARLIQLAAEEARGAAATTERQLLSLVEVLAGAGAPCSCFLAEQGLFSRAGSSPAAPPGSAQRVLQGGTWPCLGLVHPTLQLAAGLPCWSPALHALWPAAFRAAAGAALLALRGRGPTLRLGGRRVQLPLELCHAILAAAAAEVSCWVPG